MNSQTLEAEFSQVQMPDFNLIDPIFWRETNDTIEHRLTSLKTTFDLFSKCDENLTNSTNDYYNNIHRMFEVFKNLNEELTNADKPEFSNFGDDLLELSSKIKDLEETILKKKKIIDILENEMKLMSTRLKEYKQSQLEIANAINIDTLTKIKLGKTINDGDCLFVWIWVVVYHYPKENYEWEVFKKEALERANGLDFKLRIEIFEFAKMNQQDIDLTFLTLEKEAACLKLIQAKVNSASLQNLFSFVHLAKNCCNTIKSIRNRHDEWKKIEFEHMNLDAEKKNLLNERRILKGKMDIIADYQNIMKKATRELKLFEVVKEERNKILSDHKIERELIIQEVKELIKKFPRSQADIQVLLNISDQDLENIKREEDDRRILLRGKPRNKSGINIKAKEKPPSETLKSYTRNKVEIKSHHPEIEKKLQLTPVKIHNGDKEDENIEQGSRFEDIFGFTEIDIDKPFPNLIYEDFKELKIKICTFPEKFVMESSPYFKEKNNSARCDNSSFGSSSSPEDVSAEFLDIAEENQSHINDKHTIIPETLEKLKNHIFLKKIRCKLPDSEIEDLDFILSVKQSFSDAENIWCHDEISEEHSKNISVSVKGRMLKTLGQSEIRLISELKEEYVENKFIEG